jgi:hypothetical protein
LDDTKETIINLKTQIEGAKEKEESLKIQLTKKEETCHMMEMEVINLKKKNEKTKTTVKFQNNSTILDKIWNSQIPTDEKTSLGYNKKEECGKWSTIQKHDKGSYSSKEKGTVTNLKQTMKFVKEVLMLESIKTETTTSRGYESPMHFFRGGTPLLLQIFVGLWVFRIWDFAEVHRGNQRKIK